MIHDGMGKVKGEEVKDLEFINKVTIVEWNGKGDKVV